MRASPQPHPGHLARLHCAVDNIIDEDLAFVADFPKYLPSHAQSIFFGSIYVVNTSL
jgi:hypothetical protein